MESKGFESAPSDIKLITHPRSLESSPSDLKLVTHPRSLESSPSDLKLVAHPRAKSKVWKYFGFDTNSEGCILQWKKIYCRICMAQIAYSGNTSNLSYHLEKNHPDEFCEFVKSNTEQMREAFAIAFSKLRPEMSQQVAHDALIMKTNYSYEHKKHQEMTAAVINFISEGMYPASVVDEPTFKALLKTADPRYELPDRKYFCTKALPEKYNLLRDIVLKELSEVLWCGISTDIWKSENQNRLYVTVAVHALTSTSNGLSFMSRCLKTFEVPEENTVETITRALYESFIEWGVNTKVFGASTDYSKDIIKACSLLDLPVHMPCFGHAMNQGIQKAFQLPKLFSLLTRCRRVVEYFQQSVVAMYMLNEKQKVQNSLQCMLVSDRTGWWGSTLAMLQRLKEQQFVIAAVLAEDSNNHHLMLEATEWCILEGLIDLLQPFKQVAELLSTSKYPTISMVKPLLHMLLNTTVKVWDSDIKEISMAKEVIAKELSSTYKQTPEIDMFLNVATFLDPRYKKLPFLSVFERSQVENRVLEEAKSFLEKEKDYSSILEDKNLMLSEEPPEKVPRTTSSPPPSTSNINNMLAEIFCHSGADEDQEEWRAQIIEELSNFKSQKVLGLNGDPLKWWSDRLALFPILPKVLQKYWCIPTTRIFPERLFGSSANVVSGKRSRLAPAHVDQQIFLYENSRSNSETELGDEDEGEWGLEQDQILNVNDTLNINNKFFP